jgi:hypothetical protein
MELRSPRPCISPGLGPPRLLAVNVWQRCRQLSWPKVLQRALAPSGFATSRRMSDGTGAQLRRCIDAPGFASPLPLRRPGTRNLAGRRSCFALWLRSRLPRPRRGSIASPGRTHLRRAPDVPAATVRPTTVRPTIATATQTVERPKNARRIRHHAGELPGFYRSALPWIRSPAPAAEAPSYRGARRSPGEIPCQPNPCEPNPSRSRT